MDAIEVYALNEAFEPVTVNIPYTNLQWTRRYYSAGEFSMQLPVSAYDPAWAYIGTGERPEFGIVQKRQYTYDGGDVIQLSGFFYEKRLDDRACFPRYVADKPTTEEAARALFSTYKADLPLTLAAANSPLLGDRTRSDFTDDPLGEKLYRMLETRELSQRVTYDYVADRLTWGVWQGKDRTQDQTENAWVVFSSDFGNVEKLDVNEDSSDYFNYCIIPAAEDENGKETVVERVDLTGGGYRREMVLDKRSTKPDDGQSDADFRAALRQEGMEKLLEKQVIREVDIDAAETGYLLDYDLGDLCGILIPRFGLELSARIVEVAEVFKAGQHSATLGFGNKRLRG